MAGLVPLPSVKEGIFTLADYFRGHCEWDGNFVPFTCSSAVSLKKFIVLIVWVILFSSSLSTLSVWWNSQLMCLLTLWKLKFCYPFSFAPSLLPPGLESINPPDLWGDKRALFRDCPHILHLCSEPDFRPFGQSERIAQEYFASAGKSPYFSALCFKAVWQKFSRSSSKWNNDVYKVFRLYLGMFNVTGNLRQTQESTALIRQCHEPHLSEELRTEAALLFFLKSVDVNFDCSCSCF